MMFTLIKNGFNELKSISLVFGKITSHAAAERLYRNIDLCTIMHDRARDFTNFNKMLQNYLLIKIKHVHQTLTATIFAGCKWM